MSNLPSGCELAKFEYLSPSNCEGLDKGLITLEGVLLGEVAQICTKCLGEKAKLSEPLCNPILVKRRPDDPPPFLIQFLK